MNCEIHKSKAIKATVKNDEIDWGRWKLQNTHFYRAFFYSSNCYQFSGESFITAEQRAHDIHLDFQHNSLGFDFDSQRSPRITVDSPYKRLFHSKALRQELKIWTEIEPELEFNSKSHCFFLEREKNFCFIRKKPLIIVCLRLSLIEWGKIFSAHR